MRGPSRVGARSRLEGRLESRGEVLVFGTIEGEVSSEALVIDVRGTLNGEARARRILVRGRARADLVATQVVELEASATVFGMLKADRVLIEDGADFSGNVHMAKPRSGRDDEDEF